MRDVEQAIPLLDELLVADQALVAQSGEFAYLGSDSRHYRTRRARRLCVLASRCSILGGRSRALRGGGLDGFAVTCAQTVRDATCGRTRHGHVAERASGAERESLLGGADAGGR